MPIGKGLPPHYLKTTLFSHSHLILDSKYTQKVKLWEKYYFRKVHLKLGCDDNVDSVSSYNRILEVNSPN